MRQGFVMLFSLYIAVVVGIYDYRKTLCLGPQKRYSREPIVSRALPDIQRCRAATR